MFICSYKLLKQVVGVEPDNKSSEEIPEIHSYSQSLARQKKKRHLITSLLLVVSLAVLVSGTYVYIQSRKTVTQPIAKESLSSTAAISITDNGTMPIAINVKSGTQVTWTNNSTQVHQVAADPYPQNDSIPNFDSNVVLKPNDSISFIFDSPGIYTYHDEKDPSNKLYQGTIVVE